MFILFAYLKDKYIVLKKACTLKYIDFLFAQTMTVKHILIIELVLFIINCLFM